MAKKKNKNKNKITHYDVFKVKIWFMLDVEEAIKYCIRHKITPYEFRFIVTAKTLLFEKSENKKLAQIINKRRKEGRLHDYCKKSAHKA